MTETVSSRLVDALRAAGIPAYPEYPQVLKPMPHVPFFVTAACAETLCGEPVNSSFGDAADVRLTIRLRMHCRTDYDPAELFARTEDCILHTIAAAHFDLRGIRTGELQYVPKLDRLVREMQITVGGTIYLSGGDQNDH